MKQSTAVVFGTFLCVLTAMCVSELRHGVHAVGHGTVPVWPQHVRNDA